MCSILVCGSCYRQLLPWHVSFSTVNIDTYSFIIGWPCIQTQMPYFLPPHSCAIEMQTTSFLCLWISCDNGEYRRIGWLEWYLPWRAGVHQTATSLEGDFASMTSEWLELHSLHLLQEDDGIVVHHTGHQQVSWGDGMSREHWSDLTVSQIA